MVEIRCCEVVPDGFAILQGANAKREKLNRMVEMLKKIGIRITQLQKPQQPADEEKVVPPGLAGAMP